MYWLNAWTLFHVGELHYSMLANAFRSLRCRPCDRCMKRQHEIYVHYMHICRNQLKLPLTRMPVFSSFVDQKGSKKDYIRLSCMIMVFAKARTVSCACSWPRMGQSICHNLDHCDLPLDKHRHLMASGSRHGNILCNDRDARMLR